MCLVQNPQPKSWFAMVKVLVLLLLLLFCMGTPGGAGLLLRKGVPVLRVPNGVHSHTVSGMGVCNLTHQKMCS